MKTHELDYCKLTDVHLKYELKKPEASILEKTTDPLASSIPKLEHITVCSALADYSTTARIGIP